MTNRFGQLVIRSSEIAPLALSQGRVQAIVDPSPILVGDLLRSGRIGTASNICGRFFNARTKNNCSNWIGALRFVEWPG
jgi:hypothetical protein